MTELKAEGIMPYIMIYAAFTTIERCVLSMECVAYMRVSTEKQAEEGNGLESQKRDIENYCRKNALIINDWYVDDGYTGANMERPELQRLVQDCNKHRVKCVVAYKLDRLSRSMIDGLYLIERVFVPNQIDFRCVHDSVSYGSPMEQAYTQMMAVFAQLDKNTMRLRMQGGLLERVKKGYWPRGGKMPYCYTYDREKGYLVQIPERAEKARLALEMYIDGYSERVICEKLNFSSELVVRHVLRSNTNIGMIPYKGRTYQGLHEPIFDKERFMLAQEIRKSRLEKRTAYHGKHTRLLTGLCYCGICGCKMRYQTYPNGDSVLICYSHGSHYYRLPNHDPNCTSKVILAKAIEDQVETEVKKISINVESYKPIQKESRLEQMYAQLSKDKVKLKRLYEVYAEGNDTVLEIIKDLESAIDNLKHDINVESKSETGTPKKEFVYDNIKRLADIWDNIEVDQKNAVLKSIIKKIKVVNTDAEIILKEF